MYKLILADGTELNVGLCGSYDGGPLYIEVYDKTFIECAQIFGDAAKTASMTYDYSVGTDVFEGFTQLTSLALEADMIRVTMRRQSA